MCLAFSIIIRHKVMPRLHMYVLDVAMDQAADCRGGELQ